MNLKKALRASLAIAALSAIAQPAFAQEPAQRPDARLGKIFVTLDTSSEAVLERQRGSEWVVVCTGTCGEMLPLDGYYRVAGSGIRDSKPFRLDGAPGERLVISTITGSTAAYDAGIFLTVTGGLGLSTAGWILYYELFNSIDDPYGDAAKGRAIGREIGAASAVLTTIGIVLIASNPASAVSQSANGRDVRAEPSAPVPTWGTREVRGLPSANVVSLFSGTF